MRTAVKIIIIVLIIVLVYAIYQQYATSSSGASLGLPDIGSAISNLFRQIGQSLSGK